MKKMLKTLVTVSSCLIFMGSVLAEGAKTTPLAPVSAPPADKKLITLTSDNTLIMDRVFRFSHVAKVAKRAKDLDSKMPSGDPLFLVMNSPGGSVSAGLELIENLNALNRPVHTITLFSVSMGFQTVQGLGERYILENGTLMAHKAKGVFKGEFPGQIDSRYNYILKKIARLDEKVVERTQGVHTLESFRALYENEYWCDGEDCIEQGLADEIVKATCDDSLKGTKEVEVFRTVAMGSAISVTFVMSNCPTITGALAKNIYIDGEPLFDNKANTSAFRHMSYEKANHIKNLLDSKLEELTSKRVIKGY